MIPRRKNIIFKSGYCHKVINAIKLFKIFKKKTSLYVKKKLNFLVFLHGNHGK